MGVLKVKVGADWVPVSTAGPQGPDEIIVSTVDPIVTYPTADLWYDSDATAATMPVATDTVAGIVELATIAEADARTAADRALTPASMVNAPRGIWDAKGYAIAQGATLTASTSTRIWTSNAKTYYTGRQYKVCFGIRALALNAAGSGGANILGVVATGPACPSFAGLDQWYRIDQYNWWGYNYEHIFHVASTGTYTFGVNMGTMTVATVVYTTPWGWIEDIGVQMTT